MPTQDQQPHFQALADLDQILINLNYASRDLLGDPEAFKTLEATGYVDEVLKDRGIEPAMIVEARSLQAILRGTMKVPEKGFVFGTLNGKGQLLMAITSCDPPGFALIAVMSARPISFGDKPSLTAADVAASVRIQASVDGDDPLGQVILAKVSLPHVPTSDAVSEHDVLPDDKLVLPGDSAINAMLANMKIDWGRPN
jgi:hypothetical protein